MCLALTTTSSLPVVARNVGVVVVRHDVEPRLTEWQFGIVEVKDIGTILVDQILAAEEPLFSEPGIHRRRVFVPDAIVLVVPIVHRLDAGDTVRDHDVAPGVEVLRIETFPPFALAVIFRQPCRIVTLAGVRSFGVVSVCGLETSARRAPSGC